MMIKAIAIRKVMLDDDPREVAYRVDFMLNNDHMTRGMLHFATLRQAKEHAVDFYDAFVEYQSA